jgi:dolichyl-phosphate-mannose-protein mannosyltransferase
MMRMTHSPTLRRCVWLWLILRLLSLIVAVLAFLRYGRESLTSLTTLLFGPWYAWDVVYYVEIVRIGYQPGSATTNFHPLYPGISKLVAVVIRDPIASLLIVSSVASLLLTIMLYKLARLDCNEEQSWQATALFLAWPVSVALFLPYTEALFLLLSVCSLLAIRRNQFLLAVIAAALATLTRQQGLFLALPLVCEVWISSERRGRKVLKSALTFASVAGAYAGWIVYRSLAINDVHPDFSSMQKFIHTVMISPSSYNITEHHEFLPPWSALWKASMDFWHGDVMRNGYVDVVFGVLFIGMFALSWRHLRMSYRVYCVVIILISLSFYAGSIDPFIALPRHFLLAFPVFIGLAARPFKKFSLVLFLLIECQIAMLCAFVWKNWVP